MKDIDDRVAKEIMGLDTCPDGFTPSVSIESAWQVVEKMAANGWSWRSEWKGAGRGYEHTAEGSFDRWKGSIPMCAHATADTMPLCVCLASLQSLEPGNGQ